LFVCLISFTSLKESLGLFSFLVALKPSLVVGLNVTPLGLQLVAGGPNELSVHNLIIHVSNALAKLAHILIREEP